MTGIIEKLDLLAAKLGDLASATGRDIHEILDEMLAHVEGKVEAATPKAGDGTEVQVSEGKVVESGATNAAGGAGGTGESSPAGTGSAEGGVTGEASGESAGSVVVAAGSEAESGS